MEQMQFTAIVLMTLLTLKLLLLPVKAMRNVVVNRSRWLFVASMVILILQFLLQYTLHLRAMGVTQAVMLNLVMFVPAAWLMTLAILCLQRQGQINSFDRWVGPVTWVVVMLLLGGAVLISGKPLPVDTPEMRWAEIISSVCFAAMLGYFAWRHLRNLRAMRRSLQNYYDRDMDGMLRWMRWSVIILPIMGLMVPVLIFVPNILLAIFAMMLFGGIFYLVDCFCIYVVSSAPAKVREAEENEQQEEQEKVADQVQESTCMSPTTLQRVGHAVERWKENGGHLQGGLKLPNAASAIGVPQYLLSNWLRQQNLKYNEWITDLRIEEAKHMLTEHPDWSNEAVALHCGFTDRSYFQRKFKEKTGLSPSDFIGLHSET
jgi:AraC-like DNA-binding protein